MSLSPYLELLDRLDQDFAKLVLTLQTAQLVLVGLSKMLLAVLALDVSLLLILTLPSVVSTVPRVLRTVLLRIESANRAVTSRLKSLCHQSPRGDA